MSVFDTMTSTTSFDDSTLTFEKFEAMMRRVKDIVRPPWMTGILVGPKIGDSDHVTMIDWTKMQRLSPTPPEWNAMCCGRAMVKLARMIRPDGFVPIRVWKRHGIALYRFYHKDELAARIIYELRDSAIAPKRAKHRVR